MLIDGIKELIDCITTFCAPGIELIENYYSQWKCEKKKQRTKYGDRRTKRLTVGRR